MGKRDGNRASSKTFHELGKKTQTSPQIDDDAFLIGSLWGFEEVSQALGSLQLALPIKARVKLHST